MEGYKLFGIRFIPAGAGNTRIEAGIIVDIEAGIIVDSAVYPRWRGEHAVNSVVFMLRSGLSPLARGTHPHL